MSGDANKLNLIGPYVANLLHLKRSSLFGKVRVALGWEVIVAHPPTVDFKSVLSPKTLDQFKPVGFTSLWTVPDAVHFACTPSNLIQINQTQGTFIFCSKVWFCHLLTLYFASVKEMFCRVYQVYYSLGLKTGVAYLLHWAFNVTFISAFQNSIVVFHAEI